MDIPKVIVYYDGVEQDFAELVCCKDDIVKMELTFHKQFGAEHVLKVKVQTGKKVLAVFKFGQKTFSLVSDKPTFDGFFDESSKKTKQFKLGDLSTIKHLIEDNDEQMEKLINQDPELKIEIKEWIDEKPMWKLVADSCRSVSNKVTTDNETCKIYRDGGEKAEGRYETFTDCTRQDREFQTKPVGYESNVLNKDSYVNATGKEGNVVAKITITFVSKQIINVV